MAKFCDLNQPDFDNWLAERPPVIREMVKAHPPNLLYRMASTGHRCTIISYGEDGTLRVSITGQYNRIIFGRQVFGIAPADLTECDLPGPDEDVGDTAAEAGYTDEDVRTILIPRIIADAKIDV